MRNDDRNALIYHGYCSGMKVVRLAYLFNLSARTISKIIQYQDDWDKIRIEENQAAAADLLTKWRHGGPAH